MLQRLQPKDSGTDLLFIGTDRLQYFNVAWNPETRDIETVEQTIQDTAEPYMRHSQSQNRCLVDPTGRFMAMHLWEGVLNVFRLPTRKGLTTRLEALESVRLTELWMKTSTFIHSRTGHPKIAFLYKTRIDQEEARIAVYRLTKDDKGGDVSKFDPHKDRELDQVMPDPYASLLIPVPVDEEKRYHVRNNEGTKAHLGGLLVVGETLLTYFDSLTYSSLSSSLPEPRIYVAWEEYDSTRYLLADDYGRLDLLTIETRTEPTGIVVTGMNVMPMRFEHSGSPTSRASKLVAMRGDILFVASHHGDSQLIKLDIETRTMSLIKSISNNAPILDFAIMDMGNREGEAQLGNAYSSGQARIVAGCGAYHDGSLRSIRSGVGLEDYGILDDIEDTKGVFSLRSHGAEKFDTLAVSSVAETRILRFDANGAIEETYEFQGMALDTQTLWASTSDGGNLLQITQKSVFLLDTESGVAVSRWDAPEGKVITASSANGRWALLSVDGSMLVSLNLLGNLAAETQLAVNDSSGKTDQISCIHVSPHQHDLGVVGWWSSGSISIVDLRSLKALHGEALRSTEGSTSVPRDVALIQLHPRDISGPTLFVALEDGNIITFNVSAQDFSLSSRKRVTLGSNPAKLNIIAAEDGTANIFATTEHASLIYSSEGRIIYSATTADDATFVAPFHSEAFPNCIALATDSYLRIGHVDNQRLTHVRALPMKQTVRRVAYSSSLRAFGLGCIKKELIDNEEVITSSFRLVDEIVFRELGEPFVLNRLSGLELVECVIRAALPDSSGNHQERFIIGTSLITEDDTVSAETAYGRIIILGVDEDRRPYQLVSHNLKGACRCLGMINDNVVAGLAKTVVVYSFAQTTSSQGSLQKLAAYRPAAFPVDLDISGSIIGVVDLMQSLTLVEFIPAHDGEPPRLEEKARHYQPGSATAVCHVDGDMWVEADAQCNILVLRRNLEALTVQDQRRLEVTSEMNIGEQINRIRKLQVATNENSVVSPQAFLASVCAPSHRTRKRDEAN